MRSVKGEIEIRRLVKQNRKYNVAIDTITQMLEVGNFEPEVRKEYENMVIEANDLKIANQRIINAYKIQFNLTKKPLWEYFKLRGDLLFSDF